MFADLMVLGISHAWDASIRVRLHRKPAKFPFINLLAAVAWDPAGLRTVDDLLALDEGRQGIWTEWLVAQESWRRAAIAGRDSPELLLHRRSESHEVDCGGRSHAQHATAQSTTGDRSRQVQVDLAWSYCFCDDGADEPSGCGAEPVGAVAVDVALLGDEATNQTVVLDFGQADGCDGCGTIRVDGNELGPWCDSRLSQ